MNSYVCTVSYQYLAGTLATTTQICDNATLTYINLSLDMIIIMASAAFFASILLWRNRLTEIFQKIKLR